MAKKETKMKCLKCGSEKMIQRDFYRSASELHNGSYSRIPICKTCIIEHYNKLLNTYDGNSNSAFRHWCITFDTYYDETLYLQCIEKDNFIGDYMRLTGSTKDRKDKTSLNNKLPDGNVKVVELEDGSKITDEYIDKWGEGYSASQYRKLERKYKIYSEHYPNKRLQEQEILKQLVELDVMKEECRISGDKTGYDKISTQIRKTMEDLNVLPKQSADEEEQLTLGNIIKMIEYEEPIPMTSPEFDDINKIEEIMDKYFITPFKRVLGLKSKDFGEVDE